MNTNVNTKNNIFLKLLIIFFLFISFLTFFSSTINKLGLPRVTIKNPVTGQLLKVVMEEGTVEVKEVENVYLDIDGSVKISDIKVRVGDRVKKGDVLMTVDNEEITRQLETEKLVYNKLQLTKEELQRNYQQRTNLKSIERSIETAKKSLEDAKKKYETANKIYQAGAEINESMIKSKTVLENAQREYDNKLEDYKIAEEVDMANLNSSIKKNENDLKLQELKIKRINDILSSSNDVVSPVDGIIKDIGIIKGSKVNNNTNLCSIVNTNGGYELKCEVDIDNADLLAINDTAKIKLKAMGQEELDGKVLRIENSTKEKGVKKEVTISIPGNNFLGGEKGEIYIEKRTSRYEYVVPKDAIVPGVSENDGYIRVLKKTKGFIENEEYAELVQVAIVDSNSDEAAISGVISKDDRVVVKTDKPLSDNSRVRIEKIIE